MGKILKITAVTHHTKKSGDWRRQFSGLNSIFTSSVFAKRGSGKDKDRSEVSFFAFLFKRNRTRRKEARNEKRREDKRGIPEVALPML
jgi:hypothetical protein